MLFLNLLFAQAEPSVVSETATSNIGRYCDESRFSLWLHVLAGHMNTLILASVVLSVLAIASWVANYLTRRSSPSINPALVERFVLRLWSWWLMFAILIAGLFLKEVGTIVLFGLVSFWAFREFITMTPTRRGDHRALFWSLVVFTPLQYVLIGLSPWGIRVPEWKYDRFLRNLQHHDSRLRVVVYSRSDRDGW